jgi:hypothetical protein
MLRNQILVFDEFIPNNGVATYTHERFNHVLGAFDQLALMAVVDNVSTTTTDGFDIWVAHSADARQWLYRGNEQTVRTHPPLSIALNGDIHWPTSSLVRNAPNLGLFRDPGTTPLLAYIRLELAFTGTATSAHVKVYAVQRDQGG